MGRSTRFTDKQIKSLTPKAERYTEWEPGGLGVRVGTSGKRSFVYLYRYEGRPRRITLGAYPSMSLAAARVAQSNAVKALEEGKDPGAERVKSRRAERASETIGDLADLYLERHARRHKRSADADERMLNAEVIPTWGERKASSITRRDIIELLDGVVDRGSPVTANRLRSLLSKMFAFAIERDILAATPFMNIPKPAKETARERVLSPTEIHTLWHGLEGDKIKMSRSSRLALKLLLVTLQRREEVVRAPWSEFDIGEKVWELPGERTKNGNPHRVPLSALALDLLEGIRAESDGSPWLFPAARGDGPMTPAAISHALRNNLDELDLENVTPHDLRRTGASLMTEMGIGRLVVDRILNHVDSSVGGVYDRYSYGPEKARALEAWGGRLNEVIAGTQQAGGVIPFQKR